MNVYLIALKKRLDNGDITQATYDSLAIELKEPVIEVVEYVPTPTLEDRVVTLEETLDVLFGGV